MSGPLFNQYKAALRRGHLATLAGTLDEALEAYRDASRLVPERALPFANQGTVLHRLDRWPEAETAFDQALRLAPDDEATLRARGTARAERGRRSGAADDFERLAFVLDIAGHAAAAVEAARRAAVLESSPARAALVTRLEASATRASEIVQDPAPGSASGPEWVAVSDAAIPEPSDGNDGNVARRWPAVDLPSPPPPPIVGPPPDPEVLLVAAGAALDRGDLTAARNLILTAVMVHRAAGHLDAALDACLQLLAVAPGDPQVHLAIANLELDQGWTGLASEKIELLLRLTSLTGDTQAEADAHGLASERLRDYPTT